MDMGKRLKIARKEAKLSLAELGEAIGVSDVTVMRWERGGPMPASALLIIAKLTKKPLEYFLMDDNELSDTKLQSASKLGEIIDLKDSEIDKLKRRIKELEDAQSRIDNLDKAIKDLKDKTKKGAS